MPRRNKRSQMHNLDDSFALATMDIMIGCAISCCWQTITEYSRHSSQTSPAHAVAWAGFSFPTIMIFFSQQ